MTTSAFANVPPILKFIAGKDTEFAAQYGVVDAALNAMQDKEKRADASAVIEAAHAALAENGWTEEGKAAAIAAIHAVADRQPDGKAIPFPGEVAVSLGAIDQGTFDEYLVEHSLAKAQAAMNDIATLAKEKTPIETPAWLKANWGTNGVTKAKDMDQNPSDDTIKAAAAANIAQNIFVTLNQHPDLLGEKMQRTFTKLADEFDALISTADNPTRKPEPFFKRVVSNLFSLVRGVLGGDSQAVPLKKHAEEWKKSAEVALKAIARKVEITDDNGTKIDMKDYIGERFKEIDRGVNLSLARKQDRFLGKEPG